MFSLSNEAIGAKDSAMEFIKFDDIFILIVLLIITIIFIVLYFFLQRRCFKLYWRLPYKIAILLLIIPCVKQFNNYNDLLDKALHQEDFFQVNKTDYYIYDTIPSTNQFVEKFGIIPFAYRDFISYYETDLQSADDYKIIDEFFNSRSIHEDNEMTGIFKGKNIIFIQAESFIDLAIDEKLTPTLYKFKNEGIVINGFNTPGLSGSTSDTEFMANTSIMPNSEGYAISYKYPDNAYLDTLPSLFNKAGYKTTGVHNNYGTYYNRNLVFPSWGYETFMECIDFGLEDENPDSKILDILKWIYVETDKPYMTYWVTYSGHQPYSLDSIGVNEKDVLKIKELYPNLDDSYVSYLAKNMDLDRGLNDLISELKKVNKLDDVVFVFYGDHFVKGLDFDDNFYNAVNKDKNASDKYTDLFIYNSETEGFVYDKIATTLDLLPTIANMWDLKVDYRKIQGSDIFDENYEGFYFSEWENWKIATAEYDYINAKLIKGNKEDIEKFNYYINLKEVAKKILKLDYFKGKE